MKKAYTNYPPAPDYSKEIRRRRIEEIVGLIILILSGGFVFTLVQVAYGIW